MNIIYLTPVTNIIIILLITQFVLERQTRVNDRDQRNTLKFSVFTGLRCVLKVWWGGGGGRESGEEQQRLT